MRVMSSCGSRQTGASDGKGFSSASPIDDGAAKHLIAGTRLPDVALPATRGANVNLARYQERAIVFVYPMTGTPGVANPPDWDVIPGAHGSTPEAEGFRDAYAEFELLGYEVFGLSGQSSEISTLLRFGRAFRICF